ncbi:peptide-methionine (R)-S-oxide reductase MsrB [bacterium]|nr:peptide-methionine (R)-S-oxide reductase MsrB [bacterium]
MIGFLLLISLVLSPYLAAKPGSHNKKREYVVNKSDEQWRNELTPEQYRILRQKGTERAFTGKYYKTKTPGVYLCAACGNELFSSEHKYDSGSGWPSFYKPIEDQKVEQEVDNSLFVKRTEVLCKRCGSHLGHVFDDGPKPTGKRFCINSECLRLKPEQNNDEE